jgi:GH35 family endo-1,4-beta-xylanase
LKAFADDPDELRRQAERHIAEIVAHFRGDFYQWDVINEPFKNHDLMDTLGKEVMIDWFRVANQSDPGCKLFLNEFGIVDTGGTNRAQQEHFFATAKYLKEHGAPIHGIGIQSHFGMVLTPPVKTLKILDHFSELGLPIESTELSLNIADRQLQADFMRDYMTAFFSHPNVHGIMLWGFWEGRHWRPDAALFGLDWKLRPHGEMWIDLVHKQWKTDVELTTDRSGAVTVRGFCGEYDLTIGAGDRAKSLRIDLPHGGHRVTVVLDE